MKKQKVCPLLDEAGIDIDNRDNGIEICLNCTLKKCVYEVTTRSRRKMEIRRAQVRVLSMEGKSNVEIARLLKVSEATISLDKKAIRENENGAN